MRIFIPLLIICVIVVGVLIAYAMNTWAERQQLGTRQAKQQNEQLNEANIELRLAMTRIRNAATYVSSGDATVGESLALADTVLAMIAATTHIGRTP